MDPLITLYLIPRTSTHVNTEPLVFIVNIVVAINITHNTGLNQNTAAKFYAVAKFYIDLLVCIISFITMED